MKSVCCICGAPIESEGRDTPIYCEEHRRYTQRDDMILQNLSLNDTFSICAAILQRARDDYLFDAEGQRSDAEWFFRSNWAQVITNGTIDAEFVIAELNRRIDELNRVREDTEQREWE